MKEEGTGITRSPPEPTGNSKTPNKPESKGISQIRIQKKTLREHLVNGYEMIIPTKNRKNQYHPRKLVKHITNNLMERGEKSSRRLIELQPHIC